MTLARAALGAVTLAVSLSLARPAPAQPAPAQPTIAPFQVAVSLTPQAAARLASLQESITVAAMFFGEPTPAATRQADRMGQIGLGREEVVIPGRPGTATITAHTVDPAKIGLLKNRAVQVLINVYSARKKVPDNLLNCTIFEDSITVAARQPIPIACKLITEGF